MQTNSRWERGTLNFIPPRKIGKRPRNAYAKCVDLHICEATYKTRLTDKEVNSVLKYGNKKSLRRRYLHVTKGWKERAY